MSNATIGANSFNATEVEEKEIRKKLKQTILEDEIVDIMVALGVEKELIKKLMSELNNYREIHNIPVDKRTCAVAIFVPEKGCEDKRLKELAEEVFAGGSPTVIKLTDTQEKLLKKIERLEGQINKVTKQIEELESKKNSTTDEKKTNEALERINNILESKEERLKEKEEELKKKEEEFNQISNFSREKFKKELDNLIANKQKPLEKKYKDGEQVIKANLGTYANKRHAEEYVMNLFCDKVNSFKEPPLDMSDVKGTFILLQSNPQGICNMCTYNLKEQDETKEDGVFKQLMDRFPNMNIVAGTECKDPTTENSKYPKDTAFLRMERKMDGQTKRKGDMYKITGSSSIEDASNEQDKSKAQVLRFPSYAVAIDKIKNKK